MHAPSHCAALPAGVDPIPVPDTEREAEMLLILLDAGLYPQYASEDRGRSDRKDSGDRGVGAHEIDLRASKNRRPTALRAFCKSSGIMDVIPDHFEGTFYTGHPTV